jgi:FMN phosphatase YigB (HAD superfamily)
MVTLVFDLDDTLFDNHKFYKQAHQKFIRKIHIYFPGTHSDEQIHRLVDETDGECLSNAPNGQKFSQHRFPKSLVLTYAKLCEAINQTPQQHHIAQITQIGYEVFDQANFTTLSEGAQQVLAYVQQKPFFPILHTKGDQYVQWNKITGLGLEDKFRIIDITDDKSEHTFRKLMQTRPCISIGNSRGSDILPALQAGYDYGICIPYEEWSYERNKSANLTFANNAYMVDSLHQVIPTLEKIMETELRKN